MQCKKVMLDTAPHDMDAAVAPFLRNVCPKINPFLTVLGQDCAPTHETLYLNENE